MMPLQEVAAGESAARACRRDRRAQGHDCAARRPVVFPVQPGGIRRVFLGLMAYLELKSKGNDSMPGNQRPCPCAGAGCCGTRAIWLKLYCLNPNLQQVSLVARRKCAWNRRQPCSRMIMCRGHLRGVVRCLVRALKEMIGGPKSR